LKGWLGETKDDGNQVTEMRAGEDTPTDALRRACRTALGAFNARRVSLWSYDVSAKTITIVAVEDSSGDSPGDDFIWPGVDVDEFHAAAQALSERAPQLVHDAQMNGFFPGALARDMGIGSILLVPLFFGGPVGVLAVEPPTQPLSPDQDHAVALAASTLGGLQVRHDAAQLRSDAQLLLELTAVLPQEDSLSRATGIVCERLGEHIGVQIALVFTPQNDGYVPRVARRCDGTDLTSQLDSLPPGLPPFGLVEAVGGSGMASVAGEGSPLVPARWGEMLGLESAVAVPLGRHPHVVGVCLLYTADARHFSQRDVLLASGVAAHLVGPLEHSRSLEERHFNMRAASEVRRLFEDSSRAVSVEEAAEAFARVVRDAAGTEQTTVYIRDSDAKVSHALGVGETSGSSGRLGESLIGMPVRDFPLWHIIGERTEPVFVEDPRTSPLLSQEAAASLGLTSYVALPLRSPEGLIGMALCNNVTEYRTWSEEERRLVTQLAYEGSMILENALLRAADHERLHELAYQAFHDTLTKLPNRVLFDDRVEHALARADRRHEAVAVLLVDVDDFKNLNERIGHDGGDGLLVAISQRLQDCLRPEDTVARLGGDEFTILIEDIGHKDTVTMIAERVAHRLQEPYVIDGSEISVTISIGISVSWPGCMEAGALVRNADLAMYRAKFNGKARAEVFNFDLDALGQVELQAESALRRAVDQREFILHYQPKVDLFSGRMVGMEALVRWEDPERGLVPPLEFIPLAESTGLIVPIGQWVLETVCFQLRRWREWHEDKLLPTMYVNLSAQEFQRPTLVEEISDLVGRTEIHPWQLGLEITETTMMDDADTTVETLKRLRELGVKLALDDFGAGYSSLSYLKNFPVDVLKIDRQFIQGLPNAEDEAIVRAVVSLAQTLGRRVVAEGIETLEHVWLLRELGAQIGQGYYFSRPVPVLEAERLVAQTPPWMPQDEVAEVV
jgi:diguanylate cyclase (GGDEF)-like protein